MNCDAYLNLSISPAERTQLDYGRSEAVRVILRGFPERGGSLSLANFKELVTTAYEGGAVNMFRALADTDIVFDDRWLLNPDFEKMSQTQRLLRLVMLAYMKLHPMCRLDEMSEGQISEDLMHEICNTIGDKRFNAWLETWRE